MIKMSLQCSFPGCKNTSGLHSFPANLEIRQQWFGALGLPDLELPPRAGVCNQHFSQDCFSNLIEVEMGFSKVLILKASAVPNIAPPQDFRCILPSKLQKDVAAQQDSGSMLLLNVKEELQGLAGLPHSGCTLPLNVKKEEEAGDKTLFLQYSTSTLPLNVKEEGENVMLPQHHECTRVLNVKEDEEGQDAALTLKLNIKKEGGENVTLSLERSTLPFQFKEKKDEVRVPVLTTIPPPQQQRVLITNLRHIQPKPIREMGCQTERVITKHCFVQADSKPYRRSKAIQARAPHRSVPCDTDDLGADFKCVRMGLHPFKKPRCDESSEPGYQGEIKGSTQCTSSSIYVPSRTVSMYSVHEDKLMELFQKCPACTKSCMASKTVIGTHVHVTQSCAHCSYVRTWSSHLCDPYQQGTCRP